MKAFLGSFFDRAKKVLLVGVVLISVLTLFSYFFSKDSGRINLNATTSINANIYGPINDRELNKTKEGKILVLGYRALMCGLIGETCTNNPADADKNFNHSLFGQAVNLMVLPYKNPPASGAYWAYSGLQNAGFVPKTFAAEGVGFASLRPIQDLWKIFRDLSYILLVLFLIIIGFMIMFRVKVNPQTIVKLENSLPRIILALILITFSFAIAGFLIDLMYVIILVGISSIAQVNIGDLKIANVANLQNRYIGAGMGDLFPIGGDIFQVGLALVDILPGIIRGVFKGVIAFIVTNFIVFMFLGGEGGLKEFFSNFKGITGLLGGGLSVFGIGGSATGGFSIGNLPGVPSWLVQLFFFLLIFPYGAGILIGLIFAFTLFFFVFRVFFLLMSSYIKILLLVIFAPIILLGGVFPGKNIFMFWLKNLVAELITFPLVIFLMLVGYAITNGNIAEGRLFRPPFLYGIDVNAFGVLIGMGIVLLIPNLIKAVKTALGLKGPGLGFSPGLFFGGIGGVGSAASGGLNKFYYASAGLQNLIGDRGMLKKVGGWFSGK